MLDNEKSWFGLAGKVAIVTGGAMGIGAGIAEALAAAGATVVIVDRDATAAQLRVDALLAANYRAAAVALDISDEQAVVAGIRQIVAEHGAASVLVNNAGLQHRCSLLETDAATWDHTHAINTRGTFLMLRETAKAMIAANIAGRIINIASLGVRHPMVRGLAAYNASKSAVMGLTQNSAFELAPFGITVNAILPGGVITPGAMGAQGPAPEGPGLRPAPLGMCEPRDMAAAVLFFASAPARFITAQALAVDAGFLLS